MVIMGKIEDILKIQMCNIYLQQESNLIDAFSKLLVLVSFSVFKHHLKNLCGNDNDKTWPYCRVGH